MDFKKDLIASCLISTSLLLTSQVFAQESVSLDEIVVVSAYRTETNLSDVADNIVVLDQADIEALPASNVGELLNYAPGLSVVTNQGFSNPISYSVQGSGYNSNQVQVMVDGISLNNQISVPQIQRMSSENVRQVEVLGGAASAMWGSGLGGIINVISKKASEKKINARFKSLVGENRKKQETLELSGTLDKFEYYTLGEYLESGVENRQTDSNEVKTFNKFNYNFSDDSNLTLVYGADSGSNKSPQIDGFWEKFKYRQKYGKLAYDHRTDNARYCVETKFSRFNNSTEQYYALTDVDPAVSLIYKATHYQVSAKGEHTFRDEDLLLYGIDMDWEMFKSDQYSSPLTAQYQAPLVSYLLREGNLDVHLGLRYDHSKQFRDQLNPSLGVVYSFEDKFNTAIRARVARAYNYPKLIWQKASLLSGGGLTYLDNMDLRPERAIVTELGINLRPLEKVQVDLSGYMSEIKDAIILDNSAYPIRQWINKQRYRKEGLTLKLEYNITNEFKFKAGASAHRVENRQTRQYVMDDDSLRRSFDFGLYYRGKKGFNAALLANYNQWRSNYNYYEQRTNKYLLDLKTEKKFQYFSLFLNVHNLLDSEYWTDSYKPYPGRYFEGGIELNW